MAVVKANAYGHGAVACARRLQAEGADWFGVALPEEALELRAAGISKPILCLGGFWQGQESVCLQEQLVPVVYRLDLLEMFDRAARDLGLVAPVHLKVDTGMGRLGVRYDGIRDFVDRLSGFKNIRIDGLMTHFAAADDPSCESLTDRQLQRFQEAVSVLREGGHRPTLYHLANSAAIFSQPRSWGNMVRPGGVLYGVWRDVLATSADGQKLRPVMSLHSRITLLKWVPAGETIGYGCTFEASRKTHIATLPIGYNDGYLRGLSNRAHVIVKGSFAPVVGRISMDLTLIDVTNVQGVELGDQVTLMGDATRKGDDGRLSISAEELARIAGTISYEVTCGISERVPRKFSYLPDA